MYTTVFCKYTYDKSCMYTTVFSHSPNKQLLCGFVLLHVLRSVACQQPVALLLTQVGLKAELDRDGRTDPDEGNATA